MELNDHYQYILIPERDYFISNYVLYYWMFLFRGDFQVQLKDYTLVQVFSLLSEACLELLSLSCPEDIHARGDVQLPRTSYGFVYSKMLWGTFCGDVDTYWQACNSEVNGHCNLLVFA